jgi:hypothetical protein
MRKLRNRKCFTKESRKREKKIERWSNIRRPSKRRKSTINSC